MGMKANKSMGIAKNKVVKDDNTVYGSEVLDKPLSAAIQ